MKDANIIGDAINVVDPVSSTILGLFPTFDFLI